MLIKETETAAIARDFILDEQLGYPQNVADRLRATVEAIGIDDAIRKMFEESPATMLEAKTSRKYTTYATNDAALARRILLFLKMRDDGLVDFTTYRKPSPQHEITTTRIAEFNYILTKGNPCGPPK